jgi:maltooligosyltrehalose trehalohydrolase
LTVFRVWAPRARSLDIIIDSEAPFPMQPSPDDGWWTADVAGIRYRYRLDGGVPRPDPRSPSQPEGIDGPSQVVDHSVFGWTDQHWTGVPLASAVIYELHVGTFTPEATFDAVIDRLDHLIDLGVNAVELMPVAEFSGRRGWGYDGVLLYAPHHAYGGPDGLKRLIDACHGRGLAVIMDVVYNHLGPAGNYLAEYGPYFTDRYSTPWGQAVNFDGPGSDDVRRFFVDNALMWLRDYHCDGLRLDAVHAILDSSAVHVLEQLADEVSSLAGHLGRTVWLIAESNSNDPRLVRRREVGGYGLDAQWSDDFHHALHVVLTGETAGYYEDFGGGLADVATALRQVFVYDGRYSRVWGRRHGRPIGSLAGTRFVAYSQTHDQVGNRALGERLAALTTPARLRIAAALVLTGPCVPMLFQGEEWAASTPFLYFTDHGDPGLGRAVSEGRRNEFAAFGWKPEEVPDPQDPETWRRSVLRWEEMGKGVHGEMLEWYRALIALRRTEPALTDGALNKVRVVVEEDVLVVWRSHVVVACNLSGKDRSVGVGPRGHVILRSDPGIAVDGDGVGLPTDSVAILRVGRE